MQILTLQTVDHEKLDAALKAGEVILWGRPGVEGEHYGPAEFSLSYSEGTEKPYAVEIEEWSGWVDYPDSRDEPGFTGWELLDHPWCKGQILPDVIGWLQAREYPLPPDHSFTQEYRVIEQDTIAFGPRFVPTWGGMSLSQVVSRIVGIGMTSDEDYEFSRAMGAPVECYALMREGMQKQVLAFLTSIGLTPERYQQALKDRVDGKWIYHSGVGMDAFFDPCGRCDGYAMPGQTLCPSCQSEYWAARQTGGER
jgi:hypothetical protein